MKWSAENAGWKPTRRSVLLTALSLWIGPTLRAAPAENDLMDQNDQEFGRLAPNAPAALSRFAFLIGRWRCEARIKSADGEWQRFEAAWVGRFILDGYAIADEYRMTGSSGELIVLGMNFRTYDATRKSWNIKWLSALTGAWTDLVSEELGGIRFEGQSIIYVFKEPMAGHAYTRATYTNHSTTHFTWQGDKSDDGKTWSEFMVVECRRSR
jgi:hypothetical protein